MIPKEEKNEENMNRNLNIFLFIILIKKISYLKQIVV